MASGGPSEGTGSEVRQQIFLLVLGGAEKPGFLGISRFFMVFLGFLLVIIPCFSIFFGF